MKPVQAKTEAKNIIDEESRILARVTTALSQLSGQTTGAPDFDEALVNLRDQIAEAKPEDLGPLVEQMMRISAIAQRYGKGRNLPVNPASPYFAHLSLEEDSGCRDVLIGKQSFVDRKHRVQIVDWRNAPVSRIYYRYEEGDDYEEPFGENVLEGYVRARRSLTIENTRLRRIGCPSATYIADENGNWYEASPVPSAKLSGGQGTASRPPPLRTGQKGNTLGIHTPGLLRADKHLPEIAALIDPTQFDLITRPESGLIILQGGAGSGKTTVALHRIAYLNYRMPGRFRPDKMLIIVLSEAMVRYVERVLPSLGVKATPVMTADQWLKSTRRKILPQLSPTYLDDTPGVVSRFKKHPMLLQVIKEYLERQCDVLKANLSDALAACSDGDQVMGHLNELSRLAPVPRFTALRTWINHQALSTLTVQQSLSAIRRILERLRDIRSDWEEFFTDRKLITTAIERHCPTEFSPRDIDRIHAWCVRQLDDPASIQETTEEMESPFASGEPDSEEHDADLVETDDAEKNPNTGQLRLDPMDDSLLLYFALLKHGQLRPRSGKPIRYEHLVIDEAQDLSVIEIKVFLECTSEFRSVTLAGDTAQRLVFDNAFSDWETLLGTLHYEATTNHTLNLGYRSTEQIMVFARQIMGEHLGKQELTSIRSGAAVELYRFTEHGEAVSMLAEALRSLALREPMASVAMIARYPEQARMYTAALSSAEVPNVRLVMNHEFMFRAGIEVTDVTQVKGLEFDYVILLDVSEKSYPNTLESRHLLYIAATRAAHQLWLISVGEPCPLLPMKH